MSSTMNVPIAVAILLVIGCSFYYYRKMKLEQEKQVNRRKAEKLKESEEKQQDIDKEEEEEEEEEEELNEMDEMDELEIEFINNYEIREIIKSDHNDIIELCSNLYDGTDFCDNQFFNFLNDDKCIFYGCLHKKTNKIIGTAVIKIIDGGYTAFLLGIRIHLNHRRKHIASILTKYIINKSVKQYQSINRFRSIYSKSNEISIKFHDKMGFNILNNIQFLSHSSHCKQTKNGWYLFKQRMDEIDKENKNKNNNNIYNEYLCNFEAVKCRDIDNIICILLNYYKQNDIFIEWKIFDLKINDQENESNQDSEEEELEDIDNINDIDNDNEEDEDILGGGYEVIHNEDINNNINIDDMEYDDDDDDDDDDDIDDIVDEEIEINDDTTFDDGHIYENEDIVDEESLDEEDDDLYEEEVSEDIDYDLYEEDDNDYDDREYEDEYNKMSVDIRSVQDFKSHLFDQMNGGNINVYIINTNDMNQEDGALCFEFRNIEIRKHCTFYHIYGNNQMAIISMIKSCYDLWKHKIYNKDITENIDFYINSDVVMKNEKLKWLFQGADIAYIAQKYIHLNHNVDEESN